MALLGRGASESIFRGNGPLKEPYYTIAKTANGVVTDGSVIPAAEVLSVRDGQPEIEIGATEALGEN
jgi:hypothetical protein